MNYFRRKCFVRKRGFAGVVAVLLCVLGIGGAGTGKGALAAESLYFSPVVSGSEAARALALLEDVAPEAAALVGSEATMAATDLNGDGADEVFLKIQPPPVACQGACPALFFVFGLGKSNLDKSNLGGSKLFLIGRFSGTRIVVADSRTLGTRDLLVSDDPLDDFHSTRQVWDPARRRYAPWRLDSPALLRDK